MTPTISIYNGPDRRHDDDLRLRVAQMTREELVAALLTSAETGLPNLRAWQEDRGPYDANLMALVDVDGLKWVNDSWGHKAGDALLQAVALGLKNAGLEVYHSHGDEFLVHLPSALDYWKLDTIARRKVCTVRFGWLDEEGQPKYAVGANISFGVGDTLDAADRMLGRVKELRQGQGRRSPRGEMPVGLRLLNCSVVRPSPETETVEVAISLEVAGA